MNEQLTLEGSQALTCIGCGAARPEHPTGDWTSIDTGRCKACRIAADEALSECDECGEPTFASELYQDSYYLSPFATEATQPDWAVCLPCWDAMDSETEGLFWCDACNRHIIESRGQQMYYRIIEAGQWCLACIERRVCACPRCSGLPYPDSFEADVEKDLGDGGLGSGRWLEAGQ